MQLAQKVVLREKGESGILESLTNLHAKLTWKKAVDLDLHAVFQTKDGKEGKVYFAHRLDQGITLDKDAGVGNVAGDNEENIKIADLSKFNHILIVANIFSGGHRFSSFDGRVYVAYGDKGFEVPLTANESARACVVAHLDNTGITPKVVNVNLTMDNVPSIREFLGLPAPSATPPASGGGGGFFSRIFGS